MSLYSTVSLFFMVLLNLQLLGRLSELISLTAGAINVSYGTHDRGPVLTAKHITTQVSTFSIIVTHILTYEGRKASRQHVITFPFPAYDYATSYRCTLTQTELSMPPWTDFLSQSELSRSNVWPWSRVQSFGPEGLV